MNHSIALICRITVVLSFLALPSAHAAVIRGEVVRVSAPYLLIKTAAGHEVVKVTAAATLGNLVNLSELKNGRFTVECSGDTDVGNVTHAVSVVKSPQFRAMPKIEIPPGQAASWRDLPSGPDRHLIVDVRSSSDWEEGHIERSISIPFETRFTEALPGDKSSGLVLYAGDSFSDTPHRAARTALSAGRSRIRVYSGGLADWRKSGHAVAVAPSGASRILSRNEPLLVLDIRSAVDWNKGHIAGSISTPAASFSVDMMRVKGRNFKLPLLIAGYDESDSHDFLTHPALSGYHNNGEISYLEGGMAAWLRSGLPVSVDSSLPILTALAPQGEIGFREFSALWKVAGNGTVALLNIKEEDDKVPGVLHLPFSTLSERLKELPRDRELIIYCYTGTTALIAHHLLKNNGFRSRFLNRTVDISEKGELIE